jgi:Family of unknown function (DUF6308)
MPHPDPTIRLTSMDQRELVIPNARRLAEAFFEIDPSSWMPAVEDATISFDDWSAQTPHRHRFEPCDLKVLNTSMRARSPEKWWGGLFEQRDVDWLAAVDPTWQLLMPDNDWEERNMPMLMESLMTGMLRKGINISVATKALHLKRPELVPVLDSLVIEQIGARVSSSQSKRGTRARQTCAIVAHLRCQGAAVRHELEVIRDYLRGVVGKERTLVRVLDAVIWSSHPGSLIAPVARLINRWDADADVEDG